MGLITYVIIVGLAVASVSFTISVTSIFQPLREWIASYFGGKLEELVHCPYCLSHYVAAFFLFIFPPPIGWAFILVMYFGAISVSGLIHFVLLRAYEPVMRNEFERKRAKSQG